MPYDFSNRLPDPDYTIGYWGAGAASADSAASADHGPGFASVKLTSDQKVMVSRTNSGRVCQNHEFPEPQTSGKDR